MFGSVEVGCVVPGIYREIKGSVYSRLVHDKRVIPPVRAILIQGHVCPGRIYCGNIHFHLFNSCTRIGYVSIYCDRFALFRGGLPCRIISFICENDRLHLILHHRIILIRNSIIRCIIMHLHRHVVPPIRSG